MISEKDSNVLCSRIFHESKIYGYLYNHLVQQKLDVADGLRFDVEESAPVGCMLVFIIYCFRFCLPHNKTRGGEK
jgi:hypothetical protein